MTPRGIRIWIAAGVALATAGMLAGLGLTNRVSKSDITPLTQPASGSAGLTLVAYDDCAQLLGQLRTAAAKAGAQALPDAGAREKAAAPQAGTGDLAAGTGANDSASTGGTAGQDYSGTNNHESGVEEPDLIKTDGKRIITVRQGYLRVVDASTGQLSGSLDLVSGLGSSGSSTRYTPASLLLSGNRVLVLLSSVGLPREATDTARQDPSAPDQVDPTASVATDEPIGPRLLLVDIAGAPRLLGSLAMDGTLVDARQVDSVARVVVTSAPRLSTDASKAPIQDWLPRYAVTTSGSRQTGEVPCEAVQHPKSISGTSILTVYTLDLAAGALSTGNPVGVVGNGQTVYGTGKNLYVVGQAYVDYSTLSGGSSEIFQFETTGSAKPKFVAAGRVPGSLINQYSLSEWSDHLRVATTVTKVSTTSASAPGSVSIPGFAPTGSPGSVTKRPLRTITSTESWVYVLKRDGTTLTTVGSLGGLGKGERIYSVRFVGSAGYVVTFRQTDPLYTVDLQDPTKPTLRGELELTGYSAYLHPVDNQRLIGIGQQATTTGRRTGSQVSLFDVSDLASPRRLAQYEIPSSSYSAEYDPHAFLYWPADSSLVLPMLSSSGDWAALVFTASTTSISLRGQISAPAGSTLCRSLVIGNTLWTLSTTTLQANDLTTLAQQGQIAI